MLAAFRTKTGGSVRVSLLKLVKMLHGRVTLSSAAGQASWYSTIADHRLVLCPVGHGLDTHRAWETLYVGRIPVVISSAMDAAFEGLPVMILSDWNELRDAAAIAQREADILRRMASGGYDASRLWLGHFVCRIMAAAGRMTPGAARMGIACESVPAPKVSDNSTATLPNSTVSFLEH